MVGPFSLKGCYLYNVFSPPHARIKTENFKYLLKQTFYSKIVSFYKYVKLIIMTLA